MIMLNKVMVKIKSWVKELGAIQVERLDSEFEVTTKSAAIDLVTEVDKFSEEFLINKIKKEYPSHSILSEEMGREDNDSDYCWIIDPIDGTTNYANGFCIFSISIALQYKEETVLGVVYVPEVKKLYSAIKDQGAFLNEEEIEVSGVEELTSALVATGFPYDRAETDHNNLTNFNNLALKVQGVRRTGSAAFDLCSVAGGIFDAYWELKLSIWDVAAGILILQEAGGKIIKKEQEDDIALIAGNKEIISNIKEEVELKQ